LGPVLLIRMLTTASFSYVQAWVGIMLSTQSFYIGGIDDVAVARSSAFGAMAMFLGTIALSIGGIYYDAKHQPSDDASDTGENDGYELARDQPTYGTVS
jgi:hypothetical protein